MLLGAIPGAVAGAFRSPQGALVGALVGAIGGAVSSMVDVPSCPPAKPLLLIGDSLAVGLAPRLMRWADGCGVPFGHAAEVGSHTWDWTGARLDAAVGLLGPGGVVRGTVLVSLGGNDFAAAPHKERAAVACLLEQIKRAGARPRWIAPPSLPFEDKAGVREIWRRALRADPWTGYYPTDRVSLPLAADGIHPTPRGYDELAAAIWKWLAIVEG